MARLDLGWGGGEIEILVDLKTGEVHAYAGGEDFHARYGGKCYYTSRSGLSGAGWVPARPWLRKVDGYRVDTRLGVDFRMPAVAGFQIAVPFDYRASGPGDGYPAVLRRESDGAIYLIALHDIARVLAGDVEGFYEREVGIYHHPDVNSLGVTKPFGVLVNGCTPRGRIREVVEALHWEEFYFQWPEDMNRHPNRFWGRLGLYPYGTHAYKVTGGVCRGMLSVAEGDLTIENLQGFSPSNVAVLAPNLYLQEGSSGSFDAVGLFLLDGVEVEHELGLEPAEAVRAMRGDFGGIRERLEAGAREKAEQEREWQRRQQAAAISDDELQALAEANPELEVSLEDSLAVGNCEPGTRDFRDRFFPGRESVKVSELIRFLHVDRVRPVLQRKLLPGVEAAPVRRARCVTARADGE